MKCLYDFIVSVEDRYNNKVDVEGKELIVNTEISERDYIFVNRVGKVEAIPTEIETEIKIGDDVLVHHNVFRRWFNQRGVEGNGRSFLYGNYYTVQEDQIWGYWRNGSFRGLPGFTFVLPIQSESQWTPGELETRAMVKYSDQFRSGSIVGFKPGMNVPIDIDGTKYYRILNKFINVEFENKETDQVV